MATTMLAEWCRFTHRMLLRAVDAGSLGAECVRSANNSGGDCPTHSKRTTLDEINLKNHKSHPSHFNGFARAHSKMRAKPLSVCRMQHPWNAAAGGRKFFLLGGQRVNTDKRSKERQAGCLTAIPSTTPIPPRILTTTCRGAWGIPGGSGVRGDFSLLKF